MASLDPSSAPATPAAPTTPSLSPPSVGPTSTLPPPASDPTSPSSSPSSPSSPSSSSSPLSVSSPPSTTLPDTSTITNSASIASISSASSSLASASSVASSLSSATAAGHSLSVTSVTSVVATAVATTDPNGQVITTVVQSTQIISETQAVGAGSANAHNRSADHTGAIVGGTVGGIAAIGVIAILAWFLYRRRQRDGFDGDFDPDRVVQHSGPLDLGGGSGMTQVEPFMMGAAGAGAADSGMFGHNRAPSTSTSLATAGMAGRGAHYEGEQYGYPAGYGPPPAAAVAGYGPHSGSTSPGSPDRGPPSPSVYSQSQSQAFSHHPSSAGYDAAYGMTPYAPSSRSGSQPLSAKEQESRRLRVANQPAAPGPSGSSGVFVHSDGGRAPMAHEESEGPAEIPPTYESIGGSSQ